MYHMMKKKEVEETLKFFNDFSEKFPMLKIGDINIYELSKHYKINFKSLFSVIAFLDCMRVTNMSSEDKNSYYIDIEDIKSIKVNKNNSNWTFIISRNHGGILTMTHVF